MCRTFSDMEGEGTERRLLPVVKSQPGRLVYRCRTVNHVKSRSDLEAGGYSVKLTTLYDSNQRQSYIRDEIAKKHVLRYVQVPERTVDISSATSANTTKLFILDVEPRLSAKGVGPEILTAYGVEGGERILPEEFGVNELRKKFGKRPGLLINSNVAQPEAAVDVVVGRDNPRLMPAEVLRSEKDGKDLFCNAQLPVLRRDDVRRDERDRPEEEGGSRRRQDHLYTQAEAAEGQGPADGQQVASEGGASPDPSSGQQAARGDRGAGHIRAIRRQEQPPAGQLTTLICGGL
jgi:hypothetical protein